MTDQEFQTLKMLLRKFRDNESGDREEWDKRESLRFDVEFECETRGGDYTERHALRQRGAEKNDMTTEKTNTAPGCTEQQFVRCEVLRPHCRTINGTLYMLEPMFSGIVALPDDEDTRKSIAGGLLRLSPND